MMDLGLSGRRALITGGSRGIGFAVARRLAQEGCIVHLASRGAQALEAACARIEGDGGNATAHCADLTDPAVPAALLDACGPVNIVVNNAGAIPAGSIDQIDDATWRAAWDLKVFGYINMTRAALARLRGSGGVIVNIIGLAGERPDARYLAGSTGNAGLMAFTRALGAASVEDGVRVVGVNPGIVATERMAALLRAKAERQLGDAERWEEMTSGYPLGRPCAPEEVADLVAFLASERACYISGTIVTIDGGMSARGASF